MKVLTVDLTACILCSNDSSNPSDPYQRSQAFHKLNPLLSAGGSFFNLKKTISHHSDGKTSSATFRMK